jgi:hypothetical protein
VVRHGYGGLTGEAAPRQINTCSSAAQGPKVR